MKKNSLILTLTIILLAFALSPTSSYAGGNESGRSFYQLVIYHLKDTGQERVTDTYLQNAYIPALHKLGILKVGVFKPVTNDTAADKIIYVFFSLQSLEQLLKLPLQLNADKNYNNAGKEYFDAVYSKPPYTRMESVLLHAFPLATQMEMPQLISPLTERVYELRSYESATEKIYKNKVQMFNEGGEIALFKRLGFNAVFYAEVISGSHMPNLMYMTTFENMAARDAHWKTFVDDTEWKTLSAKPEYQHNVSKADIILMHPTTYSDF